MEVTVVCTNDLCSFCSHEESYHTPSCGACPAPAYGTRRRTPCELAPAAHRRRGWETSPPAAPPCAVWRRRRWSDVGPRIVCGRLLLACGTDAHLGPAGASVLMACVRW